MGSVGMRLGQGHLQAKKCMTLHCQTPASAAMRKVNSCTTYGRFSQNPTRLPQNQKFNYQAYNRIDVLQIGYEEKNALVYTIYYVKEKGPAASMLYF